MTPQRYNAWIKTSKKTKDRLAQKGVTRDEFLKAPTTKAVNRAASERRAVARMISVLPKANAKNVATRVTSMSPDELQMAIQARPDKLRSLASRSGYKTVSWSKEPINPFWYN